MLFRLKGVPEIMAARKKLMRWKQNHRNDSRRAVNIEENLPEDKIEALAKKQSYGHEEKMEIMYEIQRKFRIVFTPRFPIDKIKWIVIHASTLLEKAYDCAKKSYYVIKGRLTACKEESNKEEILEGQRGIGAVFGDNTLKKYQIYAQNTVALVIPHSQEDLLALERNVIMTTKQKERTIKSFSLFDGVEHLRKYYLPYFTSVKYNKGEYIYHKGEDPHSLYIIVDGEVAFETLVQPNHIKTYGLALVELVRQKKKEEICVTTEILSKGSYFGEEEILQDVPRFQNCRCISIICHLLTIPIDLLQKLMIIPTFLSNLRSTSNQRQYQRSKQIQAFEQIKSAPQQDENIDQIKQRFQAFKKRMFDCLTEQKQPSKISLRRSKHKIMHGHSVKMNRQSCQTEPIPFSMLEVNQGTYAKTIKRFRHSLQKIDRDKQQKVKTEIGQGRSLQKVWNVLQLQQVFNPIKATQDVKICNQDCDGRKSFEESSRFSKNIKYTHSYRPKGFTTSCRLKKEYIKYLQNLS